jgi:hypothetical protein
MMNSLFPGQTALMVLFLKDHFRRQISGLDKFYFAEIVAGEVERCGHW